MCSLQVIDSLGSINTAISSTLTLPSLKDSTSKLRYVTVNSFDELIYYYGSQFLTLFDVYGNSGSPGGSNHWSGIQWLNDTSNYGYTVTVGFYSDSIYIRRRYNTLTFTEWKAIT